MRLWNLTFLYLITQALAIIDPGQESSYQFFLCKTKVALWFSEQIGSEGLSQTPLNSHLELLILPLTVINNDLALGLINL